MTQTYLRPDAIRTGIEPDSVDVYLERFGGLAVIRELTSVQVAQSARLGVMDIASSEGSMHVSDPIMRQSIQLALCLWTRVPVEGGAEGETKLVPMFGEDAATVLPQLETIQRLGWRDHLLLTEVLERLTDGRLTLDDRAYLSQEHPTLEQLDFLKLEGNTPAAVATAAASAGDGELEAVLSVALRIPDVLLNKVPMGVVRQLKQQIDRERDELAAATAAALAALVIPPPEG